MSAFSFMPVAATRTRIEPGEYKATCTAIRNPELYRQYSRWYLRVDFSIHDDGAIVSRYLNLGTGETANLQLSKRSAYYKLWVQAVGRKPEENEPMDPAKIVNVEFWVTVADKDHQTDGVYSRVESVRREVVADVATEALCPTTSTNATETTSATEATSATTALTLQLPPNIADTLPENPSEDRLGQIESSPQIATNQSVQPDGEASSRPDPDSSSAPPSPEEQAKREAWAAEQKAKNKAEIREAVERRRAAHPELYESEPQAA